jgi:pimeloyl-ACP methyl ester carboxylesterase
MPAPGASYGDLPWTRSALEGLMALMDGEGIDRATIVAHWLLGSQLALQLALDHPDRFDAVILVGGVAKVYYSSAQPGMLDWTPARHVAFADQMGQRWFKGVTKRTWDDNNFMTYDYAVNPLRALFLWRTAAEPSLPVWIRYLLEFYAQNQTMDLARLKVPTLVVRPGFDDPNFFVDSGRTYMDDLCHASWRGVEGRVPAVEFVTVPQSRLFIMYDQPDALDRVIDRFLAAHGAGVGPSGSEHQIR